MQLVLGARLSVRTQHLASLLVARANACIHLVSRYLPDDPRMRSQGGIPACCMHLLSVQPSVLVVDARMHPESLVLTRCAWGPSHVAGSPG